VLNIMPTPRFVLRLTAVLLPLAVAGAPIAAQDPVVVTLGGAARYAADKSAGPEAARLRVEQAEARVRQRRADFLPNLSGAFGENEHTFNSASFGINFADPATGKSLFDPNGQVLGPVRIWDLRGTVHQNIFDLGSFARLKAAHASVTASGADASAASQLAAANAATAYVRALRAEAQIAARIADSTLAAELLGIARDQLSAGVGVALDVTRAQSQLASSRVQLLAARNERNRSVLDLTRALGLAPGTPVVLSDTLNRLPVSITVPSEADATALAMKTRADLRSADEQIRAGERQLDALKAERLPSLAAFADQGSTGSGINHLLPTYTVGVQLSVPIFDGFHREGRMDEQRSAIKELDVKRRDLLTQAGTEVRSALLDLAAAGEELTANDERLGLAEQELSQARDRFRAGVSGSADVITASISLNAARTQVIDARAACQSARVALARAQGTVTDLP
jgi:outer membrane protein TolC